MLNDDIHYKTERFEYIYCVSYILLITVNLIFYIPTNTKNIDPLQMVVSSYHVIFYIWRCCNCRVINVSTLDLQNKQEYSFLMVVVNFAVKA